MPENKIYTEFQYKVIKVYDKEWVAILYREKSHHPNFPEHHNWSEPRFSYLWIDRPPVEPNGFKLQDKLKWGNSCPISSMEQWNNINQHRQTIIQKIEDLYPRSSCIKKSSLLMQLYPINKTKLN